MSLKIPSSGPNLFKSGYTFSQGIEEAVIRNIQAISSITDVVRTSFGPNGRNKLIINHLGKLSVTNDAATIIKELEVVHPAAKVIIMASQQQESEVGDRTNFVLMFAGELLKKAEHLLTMGLHPSEIVLGYEMARDTAEEEIAKLPIKTLPTPLNTETISLALRSVLAAKQYGYEDLLAKLVAEATLMVMPKNANNFNVDNVRVVKILGGGIHDSRVVKGMVLPREPEGSLKKMTKAKVAVYTTGIDVAQTETKGTVLLKSAEELVNFSKGEERHLEKIIKEIADAGVNVVISGNAIGELALHYLNRYNILVLKCPSKFDLRRLSRVVGATPLARLGAPTPEEAGTCDFIGVEEIGGDRVTVFRQEDEVTRTSTILLRGATPNAMDDLERAIDDGVNVVKAIIRDPRLIPGAGASEMALALKIADFGEKTPGLAQHGIRRFAEALEVVPRTLAENAGLDSTEVVARLYAKHQEGQQNMGVDIEGDNGGVLDAAKNECFDILAATEWAIRYGTEAAITVLRVDGIIMSRAAGIKPPQQQGHWDED